MSPREKFRELKHKYATPAFRWSAIIGIFTQISTNVFDSQKSEMATDIKYIKYYIIEAKKTNDDVYAKFDKQENQNIFVNNELCHLWEKKIDKP